MRPALAAALISALGLAIPAMAGGASAQPAGIRGSLATPGFQMSLRRCRLALPAARRLVGQPQHVAQARYRPPRGLQVRYCAICTRDFRPNRLTFGLDMDRIVRSASCG